MASPLSFLGPGRAWKLHCPEVPSLEEPVCRCELEGGPGWLRGLSVPLPRTASVSPSARCLEMLEEAVCTWQAVGSYKLVPSPPSARWWSCRDGPQPLGKEAGEPGAEGGGLRQGLERQPWPQREPPRSSRYRHNSIQGLTGFRGVPHQHRVHGE